MDGNFTLNPDILQTAAGSITGDIDQIQNAVYGREVRASIAEALYLLHKKPMGIRPSQNPHCRSWKI